MTPPIALSAHAAPRLVFVTGTDTGVGKTLVARALARFLSDAGVDVGVVKPAESGCASGPDGALVPADALALSAAARSTEPLEAVCPFRYALPLAPGLAAAAEGSTTTIAALARAARAMAGRHELTLVEGAGGLLVPAAADGLMTDLIAALDAPVVLVARSALGTINHSLLSLEALAQRGARVAAVVLTRHRPDISPDEASNPAVIRVLGGVETVGPLAYLPPEEQADPDAAARRWRAELTELVRLLGAPAG